MSYIKMFSVRNKENLYKIKAFFVKPLAFVPLGLRLNFLFLLIVLLAGCTKDTSPKKSTTVTDYGRLGYSIAYTNSNASAFTTFCKALTTTGYYDTLNGAGPYTVFIPNNAAMTTYGFNVFSGASSYPNYLWVNCMTLNDFVRYLIVPQKIVLANLPMGSNQEFTTLENTPLYISKYRATTGDTVVTVNGITVSQKDYAAANGMLNVLAGLPSAQVYSNIWQRMQSDGALTYFVSAIQKAGLQTFLQDSTNLTVIAPSNDAIGTLYQTTDSATLRNIVLSNIVRGLWFQNDFVRADSTSDSLHLTTGNSAVVLRYKSKYFYCKSAGSSSLINGTYYTEGWSSYFNYYYINRATGNGILHVITAVMQP